MSAVTKSDIQQLIDYKDLLKTINDNNGLLASVTLSNLESDMISAKAVDKRKAFYENQQVNHFNKYLLIFKIIYLIFFIIFIIKVIILKKRYQNKKFLILSLALLLYPFLIDYIHSFFLNTLTLIKKYMPSNVYTNI